VYSISVAEFFHIVAIINDSYACTITKPGGDNPQNTGPVATDNIQIAMVFDNLVFTLII
jgi:hypothetical protein